MKNAEFSAHPVFDKLKQFETRIYSDEAAEKLDVENLDFYRSATGYIRSQIDKSITVLINPAELNDVHSLLDNSLSQLNSFLGNNNVGHLNNIESYLYPLLKIARNFPVPNINDDFSYSALINDFKELANQKLVEVSKSVEVVAEEIEGIQEQVTSRENEIQNVTKNITEKQTQIEALNQTFQTNFEQIKSTESTKFEELRERLKKAIEDHAKKMDEDTKQLVDKLTRK